MARGLNKVLLIGRLGQDPEVRYTHAGLVIASLNLATNSSVKNKETGQWEDATEWHRVILFERLAEVVGEFLHKGSQVYIEGWLQTRKWQDQNGQDRYTTEIIGYELQMLGGNNDSQQNNNQQQRGNQRQQNQGMTPPPARDLDEEIPF